MNPPDLPEILHQLQFEPLKVTRGRRRRHALACDRLVLTHQKEVKLIVYRFVASTFPRCIKYELGQVRCGGKSKYRYYLYLSNRQLLMLDTALYKIRAEVYQSYYEWLMSLDQ